MQLTFFKKIILISVILLSAVCSSDSINAATGNVFKTINYFRNQGKIELKLSFNTDYKIIQIDRNEILIALNKVIPDQLIKDDYFFDPPFKSMRLNRLPNDIITLDVITQIEIKDIISNWESGRNILAITLVFDNLKKETLPEKDREPEKEKEPEKKITKIEENTESGFSDSILAELRKIPKQNTRGIDVFLDEISNSKCADDGIIKKVLVLSDAGSWGKAFREIDDYLRGGFSGLCIEEVTYLRAFLFFKIDHKNDKKKLFELEEYLQIAALDFSDSIYSSYGTAMLAHVKVRQENYIEAGGLFKILLAKYPAFPGTNESMLELAKIYRIKKQYDLAEKLLTRIQAELPDEFIEVQSRLELGKVYYYKNNFNESLKVLLELAKVNPYVPFISAGLFETLGNTYYQIENYKKARAYLIKAYNYFPDNITNHLILSKIGETYFKDKLHEKATNTFKLVIEKYPGSDGYMISSFRLAEYMKNADEKEAIYNNIIKKYPANRLAPLALLRLAGLYYNQGDYNKGLKTLHKLFNEYPGTLKSDARLFMRKIYMSYYSEFLEKDDYPAILTNFERDWDYLLLLNDPELFFLVGKAYSRAHLHKKAVAELKRSYRLFQSEQRPEQLLYFLGRSLYETDQFDEAVKNFSAYYRSYPVGKFSGPVNYYLAMIAYKNNENRKALETFRLAYKLIKSRKDRGILLIDLAKVYERIGNLKGVTGNIEQSIKFLKETTPMPADRSTATRLAEKSDKSNTTINQLTANLSDEIILEIISGGYRKLGEIYYRLKTYDKAISSYSSAKEYLTEDIEKSDINFMIGESYLKANAITEAKNIYKDIVTSGDPFWSKLAKEKLIDIEIRKKSQT